MKIGVFLAYGPNVKLRNEGLGRYIGNLIKGLAEKNEIVVATPRWSVQALDDLFTDFSIPPEKVKFSALEQQPVIWGAYQFMKLHTRRGPKKAKYQLLRKWTTSCVEAVLNLVINTSNLFLFLLTMLLLLCAAVVLLPIGLVGCALFFIAFLLKNGVKKIKQGGVKTFELMNRVISRTLNVGETVRIFAYNKMTDNVQRMLVKKANKVDVDIWLVPSLFWPHTKELKKVRAIVVPDVVTQVYPARWSDSYEYASSTLQCVKTIEDGEYFITYCDYIKEMVLDRGFGKKTAIAIPHAVNDLSELITIDQAIEKKLNAQKSFTTAFARATLQSLPTHAMYRQESLINFSFRSTRYIFYPSQARPNKNLLSLIKAYDRLLRRRYIPVKLILTCKLEADQDAYQYMLQNKLTYDVLCFTNVTAQQLAALYHCADLVVNPSLYEGGFPFTFGEGMSVGTPSVMADIPQTREVVDRHGLAEDMLFDPYNWRSMADKIEWSLAHREELYEKELPMYQAMAKRDEQDVAQEYVEAFEYFLEQEKKKAV